MRYAIAMRLLTALGLLFSLSVAGFLLVHWMPGDVAAQLASERFDGAMPSEELIAAYRAKHGLDDPLPQQYLRWLAQVARLDFGVSLQSGNPVAEEVTQRLWHSLILGAASMAVALSVAIPLGIAAATAPASAFDQAAMTFAVIGMSIPNFWLALLMIQLFALWLGLLPVSGHGEWRHLVLPALVVGLSVAGLTARFVRSCMVDVQRADFMRTAHAKGLGSRHILLRHALPNALVPIVTLIGLQTARMFDSIIVVETIFGWPGLGRLLTEAVLGRDFPVLQACILAIGVVYVLINLVVDLCVAAIDPRVSGAV